MVTVAICFKHMAAVIFKALEFHEVFPKILSTTSYVTIKSIIYCKMMISDWYKEA